MGGSLHPEASDQITKPTRLGLLSELSMRVNEREPRRAQAYANPTLRMDAVPPAPVFERVRERESGEREEKAGCSERRDRSSCPLRPDSRLAFLHGI